MPLGFIQPQSIHRSFPPCGNGSRSVKLIISMYTLFADHRLVMNDVPNLTNFLLPVSAQCELHFSLLRSDIESRHYIPWSTDSVVKWTTNIWRDVLLSVDTDIFNLIVDVASTPETLVNFFLTRRHNNAAGRQSSSTQLWFKICKQGVGNRFCVCILLHRRETYFAKLLSARLPPHLKPRKFLISTSLSYTRFASFTTIWID
jgi:hypothetical protein